MVVNDTKRKFSINRLKLKNNLKRVSAQLSSGSSHILLFRVSRLSLRAKVVRSYAILRTVEH